jgi:hypothetical protein
MLQLRKIPCAHLITFLYRLNKNDYDLTNNLYLSLYRNYIITLQLILSQQNRINYYLHRYQNKL